MNIKAEAEYNKLFKEWSSEENFRQFIILGFEEASKVYEEVLQNYKEHLAFSDAMLYSISDNAPCEICQQPKTAHSSQSHAYAFPEWLSLVLNGNQGFRPLKDFDR